MGYHLTIGNAEAEIDLEDRSAAIIVKTMDGRALGAPEDSTGFGTYENEISPSYSQWEKFCSDVGLHSMFFDYWHDESRDESFDGILRERPDCTALTESHYRRFAEAKELYKPKGADDINVIRLNWLVWWTRWALDNCKYPSFANQ